MISIVILLIFLLFLQIKLFRLSKKSKNIYNSVKFDLQVHFHIEIMMLNGSVRKFLDLEDGDSDP